MMHPSRTVLVSIPMSHGAYRCDEVSGGGRGGVRPGGRSERTWSPAK